MPPRCGPARGHTALRGAPSNEITVQVPSHERGQDPRVCARGDRRRDRDGDRHRHLRLTCLTTPTADLTLSLSKDEVGPLACRKALLTTTKSRMFIYRIACRDLKRGEPL